MSELRLNSIKVILELDNGHKIETDIDKKYIEMYGTYAMGGVQNVIRRRYMDDLSQYLRSPEIVVDSLISYNHSNYRIVEVLDTTCRIISDYSHDPEDEIIVNKSRLRRILTNDLKW